MTGSSTRRVALVTGASRGIGAGIARRLAADGFDLGLVARREAGVTEIAKELLATGIEAEGIAANLGDNDEVERVARAHEARFGRLDLLVLAAGVGADERVDGLTAKNIDLQFGVNVRSLALLTSYCLPMLRATAKYHPPHATKIVGLASITAHAAESGLSIYGATKAALISFCEAVCVEESGNGVSATAISPGYVATDMTTYVQERISADTMITTDDIAEMVLAVSRLSARTVVPNIVMTRAGAEVWRA